jgi:hypothetical protein
MTYADAAVRVSSDDPELWAAYEGEIYKGVSA